MSRGTDAPKVVLRTLGITALLVMTLPMWARGSQYRDYSALRKHLAGLARSEPNLVRVDTIARSARGRKVRVVEIGCGPEEGRANRPAMLVVAGIEGTDLIGSSIVTSWIEDLLEAHREETKIADLLDTTTIYVIPRLNPDAAEQFFGTPQLETNANTNPFDDDHDGLVDEDGPEDLNGDGLVTWMRVRDGKGEYAPDPLDDRLLVKAEPLRAETGTCRRLKEGIDNDRDGKWNEDAPGGVNFNRNFPFRHEPFAADAGAHPISEIETRALAEFVVGHPNIGIVLTYGSADNLLKCPEAAAPPGRRKPVTAVDEEDAGYFRTAGELYRETLGLDRELEDRSFPGTFSDWMYFHRGRLSLAACPWNPDLAIALSERRDDPEQAESDPTNDEGDAAEEAEDERNRKERRQLEWFDEHAPQAFVRWQPFDHPDFPGKRVEIGGYTPFALTNPPVGMIRSIARKHADFLTALAQKLPRISVRETEVNHLGNSVFELRILVENTGFLPTMLSHGERAREVHPTRITLEIDDDRILSGRRITNLPPIAGSGGTAEARYTLHAPDVRQLRFTVVSALGGQCRGLIVLSKEQ